MIKIEYLHKGTLYIFLLNLFIWIALSLLWPSVYAESQQEETSLPNTDIQRLEKDLCLMYMKQAKVFEVQRNYAKALLLYEEAHRVDPDNLELNKQLLRVLTEYY